MSYDSVLYELDKWFSTMKGRKINILPDAVHTDLWSSDLQTAPALYLFPKIYLECQHPIFIANISFLNDFLFINFLKRGRERERGKLICCSKYSCIHWLILVCALARDQTCNLGLWGWCSEQLSYPARAQKYILKIFY